MNATAALPIVGVVGEIGISTRGRRWLLAGDRIASPHAQSIQYWFANRAVGLVVMEACGSAHHWARWLNARGIEVRLLPAAYVRAYVKRNKPDAADACALLEAARCAEIVPVRQVD